MSLIRLLEELKKELEIKPKVELELDEEELSIAQAIQFHIVTNPVTENLSAQLIDLLNKAHVPLVVHAASLLHAMLNVAAAAAIHAKMDNNPMYKTVMRKTIKAIIGILNHYLERSDELTEIAIRNFEAQRKEQERGGYL